VLWEQDGVTVSELGERLFLDSGTLTPLLKRLEQLGLVQRRRSSSDERELCLALSEQGLALKARVWPLKERLLCDSTQRVDAAGTLRQGLGQLLSLVRSQP